MKSIVCLLLVSALALTSGNDLEETAKSVIQKIEGQFGGHNRLNAFLDKSKTSLNENKGKGIVVAEGVGSIGGTAVIVARGRHSVAVSTKYGLGAGLLATVSAKRLSNDELNSTEDELRKEEMNSLKKPFYDKFVQPIVDNKSKSSQTVVLVEGLRGQENVWFDENNALDVKSISGFVLGTVTTVSANTNQNLDQTANHVLSNIDTHFGGKLGQNSLNVNNFIDNLDNKSHKKSGFLGAGVGAGGVLAVQVYNGKHNVNITSLYGLEAGALVGYKAEANSADDTNESTLKQMSQSLYDKYVKSIAENKGSEGVLFVAGAEEKGGSLVATKDAYLGAGALGAFKLGSLTQVKWK